ncbi:auxin response factor 18-like [Dorcoceras hygrometricum]|uniref:Auxin response factor n=1 Tax=Dorcoceras hygrometricum TaxID=472368 RepID=A0A2Z7AXP7_9LAMI|nr:auxin response factor 18-like [Dorcoceras hygrometricum]
MESKEAVKESEKCLDSQLWHACAGSMVQMPPVNSKVYYFPQGHAEHASGNVDYRNFPRIPACVPCKISAIKFMADLETDEVFAKIRLVPISNDVDFDDEGVSGVNGPENQEKPTSFAKTLTQSDANNGGGFSVPRYCAETIFPRLDYTVDPPVQTILAKDVHGETWKFRHIYRGTPRRHLLTTGWSTFVNHKKLVAGDSIVFLRAENGDLCVGIRRAKRGIGGGSEIPSGWNPAGANSAMSYGGFSTFLRDDENKLARIGNGSLMGRERVKIETVVEAATLAASGHPFEVVYYPRASTPEFCVKASLVKAALQIRWSSGIRFKMAFETEDSSRISWFMGTISSVQVTDPVRWPDSPWRLLQVTWDEPDLLQNVKRVSPWLVELVSNMPAIHLSPFSPPRKKLRLPHQSDLPLESQLPFPFLSGNNLLLGSSIPFGCRPDNTPAGMQGARHAQYALSLSDFHLSKLEPGLLPVGLKQGVVPTGASIPFVATNPGNTENISCSLTMGNSTQGGHKSDVLKATPFVLFGQPILTEKQMCTSCGSDTVSSNHAGNSTTSHADKTGNTSDGSGSNRNDAAERTPCEDLNLETGHCEVFLESEDMGRTLDLSLVGSYEELCRNLENMFDTEISDPLNHVLYWDAKGAVKQLCEEPFSNFKMAAKRLRILTKFMHRECRSVDL